MADNGELKELNQQLDQLLTQLLAAPVESEDTDILVSNLQDMVRRRQILLTAYLNEEKDTQLLNEQLVLSGKFEKKAMDIRQHRQDLLSVMQKSKNQLNIYKSVDANR
ncbi:hypothetical protein [Shewanella dokdonensis]|uniref:hypothetical protein n=1 Tax=Shewanella dokdonensis TaxID=712036 RepID=UPI00200C84BD|nr:hypothetical protein [Shewanella dokdonensis]MCL1073945.1 hypothetical protein [Shewanella dokdonensis]